MPLASPFPAYADVAVYQMARDSAMPLVVHFEVLVCLQAWDSVSALASDDLDVGPSRLEQR
jgi:hypothetical protein